MLRIPPPPPILLSSPFLSRDATACAINMSWSYGAKRIVSVPVPIATADALPDAGVTDGGVIVAKGRKIGLVGQVLHIGPVDLGPGQAIGWDFKKFPPAVADATQHPFALSDWFAGSVVELLPVITLTSDSETHVLDCGEAARNGREHFSILLHHEDLRERIYHLRAVVGGGWSLSAFFTFKSGEDVCEVEGAFTWSDPTSARMECRLGELALETKDLLKIDSANNAQEFKHWTVGNHHIVDLAPEGGVTIGDGMQVPFFGAFLVMPRGVPVTEILTSRDPDVVSRIGTLLARVEGRVEGIGEWDGNWFAFGQVPDIGDSDGAEIHEFYTGKFTVGLRLFDDAPIGLGKRPPDTGGKEDFGAVKGAFSVTQRDPRAVQFVRACSVVDSYRPTHNREANGLPLKAADHPGWVSWSERANWNSGVSPDRLGKPAPEPKFDSHGWEGRDNQHHSAHRKHEAALLTASPFLLSLLDDDAQHHLARMHGHADSPRAARSCHAAANRYLLTGYEADWDRTEEIAEWTLRNVTPRDWNDPARPVCVLATYEDRSPWSPLSAWSVWEHGLAGLHWFAVREVAKKRLAAGRGTNIHPAIDVLPFIAARTLVAGGFQGLPNGVWQLFDVVRYQGGDREGIPFTGAEFDDPLNARRGEDDFSDWVVGSLHCLVRYAPVAPSTITIPQPLVMRAASIIAQQPLPRTLRWTEREWIAVHPRADLRSAAFVSRDAKEAGKVQA